MKPQSKSWISILRTKSLFLLGSPREYVSILKLTWTFYFCECLNDQSICWTAFLATQINLSTISFLFQIGQKGLHDIWLTKIKAVIHFLYHLIIGAIDCTSAARLDGHWNWRQVSLAWSQLIPESTVFSDFLMSVMANLLKFGLVLLNLWFHLCPPYHSPNLYKLPFLF